MLGLQFNQSYLSVIFFIDFHSPVEVVLQAASNVKVYPAKLFILIVIWPPLMVGSKESEWIPPSKNYAHFSSEGELLSKLKNTLLTAPRLSMALLLRYGILIWSELRDPPAESTLEDTGFAKWVNSRGLESIGSCLTVRVLYPGTQNGEAKLSVKENPVAARRDTQRGSHCYLRCKRYSR